MKYTKEEMDIISEKIVEMLREKEEMRIGKISKVYPLPTFSLLSKVSAFSFFGTTTPNSKNLKPFAL